MSNTHDVGATFRALGDPTRVRALLLLRQEELSVGELVAILGMPQSTVSGLVRTLAEVGLLESRPEGRATWLRAGHLAPWVGAALDQTALNEADQDALREVLLARRGGGPVLEGELERNPYPGRSWEGLARGLLLALDLGDVADLGVGTGELTLLLAGAARRVYAVDCSTDALASLARRARQQGLDHVIPVQQDFEALVLPAPVDLVVLSLSLHFARSPERVVHSAFTALRPLGRLLVTELAAHDQAWVHQRLGHRVPGFSEPELRRLLEEAGFADVRVAPGARDPRPPRFRTVLAVGRRPGPEAEPDQPRR